MTPRGCGLPPEAADVLENAGFTVAGVLGRDEYDARVPAPWRSDAWMPEARCALVLGTGGGGFEAGWRAFRAAEVEAVPDPIDRFTRSVMARFVHAVGEAVGEATGAAGERLVETRLYSDPRETPDGSACFADFVALARASGLGAPSRLGLLIHPEFGPWWAVRAVALTRLELAPTGVSGPDAFDPCSGCAAPCERACPVGAIGVAGTDADRCAGHRLVSESCATRCDARRACPVGRRHALDPDDEAVYATASMAWIRDRAGAGGADRP